MLQFEYIRSEKNPADILSKHWDYASIRDQLRPILFWEGDTAKIEAHDAWKRKDVAAKEAAEKAREAKAGKPLPLKGEGSEKRG